MDAEIPQYLLTAVALDDVRVLLTYWDEVVHPIPDDVWGPNHPLFPVVLFVAYTIEDIGSARMDEAQRLATLERESFSNPALQRAKA